MIFSLCLVLQFGLSLKLAFKCFLIQIKEGNSNTSNSNGLPNIELWIH